MQLHTLQPLSPRVQDVMVDALARTVTLSFSDRDVDDSVDASTTQTTVRLTLQYVIDAHTFACMHTKKHADLTSHPILTYF
jgi:hypothetical protein